MLRNVLLKFEKGLVRVEAASAGVLLVAMALTAFGEVVLRNVFKTSLSSSDILLRQGVLWLTLIGASLAASDRRHVKLDVFARVVPPAFARWADRIGALFAAVLCGFLAKASWVYVVSEKEFGTILFGEVKAWPFETILPLGFGLLAFKFLLRLAHPEEEA